MFRIAAWLHFVVMAVLFAGCDGKAYAFQHPGIPFTIADLNTLKTNLNTQPWASGYADLVSSGFSTTNYIMQGPSTWVARNYLGTGTNYNLPQFENDMTAAYYQTLMWYFTSNSNYAQSARNILISWANTMTNLTGYEGPFIAGIDAPHFVTAADILRGTWSGWTTADTTNYQRYLTNVIWPEVFVPGTVLSANQGGYEMMGAVAVAVFCDDTNRLNQAITSLTNDSNAGFRDTLPNGEVGDYQRDQGHSFWQVYQVAWAAEVLWKQGIDAFSLFDNRILATYEYYGRYNLPGANPPFIQFGATYNGATISGGLSSTNQGGPRSSTQSRMNFNIAQGAYGVRMGLSTPWTTLYQNDQAEDQESFMYRKSSDSSIATNKLTVSFPSTSTLTTGLTSADLNGTTPTGSTAYNTGVWTLTSGYNGNDPWNTNGNDSVHFAYKSVAGDFAMVAQVTSVSNVGSVSAKAGVMLRDSLGTATNRFLGAVTAGTNFERAVIGWTNMQYGINMARASFPIAPMPYWVKMERIGNRVQVFRSPNGADWTPTCVADMPTLPSTLFVGLFGTSLVDGSASTATFANVRITGGDGLEAPKIPPAPFAIYAAPGDAQVPLRWNEAFNATAYNVKRSLTSGGGYTTIASVTNTAYTDTNVANGTTYYYVVTATNAAGESANSIQDSTTPQLTLVNVATGGSALANADDAAGGAGATQAFDINPGTKWFNNTAGASGWLQYDLGPFIRQTVTSYAITSGADVPARDPSAWQFQASNDGSTWTTLDSQTNQDFPYREQTFMYPITNTGAYRFYRLYITANSGTNALQISELALLAVPGTGTNTASSALVWSGIVNGSWDTTAANWNTNSVSTTYQNGQAVLFDDTALGSTTISNTVTVSPSGVTLNNSTKTYTFSSGAIAGTAAILKAGGGTVNLNSANTFSGGITLSGGAVVVGNNSALGSGVITLANGTLFGGSGAGYTITNTIQASANTFSTVDCSGNLTLNGNLIGSGTITRGASATVTLYLGGDNSGFTGVYQDQNNANSITRWSSPSAGSANARWVFNQAQIASRTTPNFGTGTIQFGSISGGGYIYQNTSGAATLQVGALGLNDTFSGSMQDGAGTIALTKIGAGTLTMTGTNSYSGQTTVTNGELLLGSSFVNKGNYLVTNGATLGVTNLSAKSAAISNLTLAAGCTLEFVNATSPAIPLLMATNLSVGLNGTVKITGAEGLVAGSGYPLVSYAGTLSGSVANLQLQMPYGWRGALANVGKQIVLTNVAVVATTSPQMSLTPGGQQLLLAWPSTHIGWRLQSQTNALNAGLGTNWVDVSAAVSTNQITIHIASTNGSVFFRLIYP